MRAIEPAESGSLTLDGYRIGYELFGDPTAPPVLLLPTWQIVHSRHWKMQVPYLMHSGYRVVLYDSPGNGLAERTTDPAAFQLERVVDQGIGLLDHLGLEQVDALGFSLGGAYGLWLAARYPERVKRLVLIGSRVTPEFLVETPELLRQRDAFWTRHDSYEGWGKRNAHYWLAHYDAWLQFWWDEFFPEPHSTKPKDDAHTWSRETTPEILVATAGALKPQLPAAEVIERVRCPVLLIHGEDDRIVPVECSRALAGVRPDFELVTVEGSGHGVHMRDPVKVNLEIGRFLGRPTETRRTWRRAMARTTKRTLFVSSPIGLGHALRDVAIADELRALVPGLEIEWLAQHPVTAVLERRGERLHPLSAQLAGESRHIESEMGGEHDLRVFRAWRNMDEILLANFLVFHDAVKDGAYDLWVGDEAWDVDYYLHENPELKTAPFAWLTDFVGWLPMPPDPDGRETFLTADYNAEMIEQVARFPRVRDAALFVGNPRDIVPDRFGPELPAIREWTEANYSFPGYVQYFDPAALGERAALRERLGFRPDECVALATVGGTGVGASLLRRVVEAFPHAREIQPNLRMVVVAGPRIAPESLPRHAGLEVRGYIHNLYELMAACDVALVQGGMSTCMELVATQRPFLYFPLKGHFEQNRHVPHRLANYGVPDWARVDFGEATPECIAERLVRAAGQPVVYRPIEPGGARRAAERLAALL